MQTYSHAILTAALNRPLKRWRKKNPDSIPPVNTGALMLGSILPDLLLIGISAVAIASDYFSGVFDDPRFGNFEAGERATQEMLDLSMTMRLFDVWFYENSWVMAAQNIFHSPIVLACLITLGMTMWRRDKGWGAFVFWMACAAMLHSLIDIPLHVDDGPLIFFPFNWSYRFESPISYWDPRYYGREWSIFEHALDVVLLAYLGWGWFSQRRKPAKAM